MTNERELNTFSPIVGRYFDAWINCDTWYTGHRNDEERFYKFVKAVLRYCKRRPSDTQVRQHIELKGRELISDDNDLQEKAHYYTTLYASILEFHDTLFPDVLTELRSSRACYNLLENQRILTGGIRESEEAELMRVLFGDDWKHQLE